MRGFFVFLFKSGNIFIIRERKHESIIKKLNLDWDDDNIKWLRGGIHYLRDPQDLNKKFWVFKPFNPPWWYLRNKSWYDNIVLDEFDKKYLQKAKKLGFGKVMM